MKKVTIICFMVVFVFLTGFGYTAMSSKLQNNDKKEVSLVKTENETTNRPERKFQDEKEFSEYVKQLDNEIAKSFDIDLNEYTKVEDFTNSDDPKNDKIALIYRHITQNNLERGDKKPSVYLKKDNTNNGIILYQKANKTNKIFFIGLDKDITYENPERGIVQEKSK